MTKPYSIERVDEWIRQRQQWAAYEQIADLDDNWFHEDDDGELHNLEYDEFDWRDWLAEGERQFLSELSGWHDVSGPDPYNIAERDEAYARAEQWRSIER